MSDAGNPTTNPSAGQTGTLCPPEEASAKLPSAAAARRRGLERWLGWGAVLVAVAAAVRLLNLTRLHAVNILFWDQWGYYSVIWNPSMSLWKVFNMQHGPHRGGTWYALSRLLLPWTHADVRVDAYAFIGIMMLCSLVALAIRRRITGPLKWYDVGLVLLFVPPSLAAVVANVPNPTHGALPLLFILLSTLAWTLTPPIRRYLCILPLHFLAVFTGFSLLWGVVTPLLIEHDLYRAARAHDRRGALAAGTALLLSFGVLFRFFVGYLWGAGQVTGPLSPDVGRFAAFVCLVYARVIGVVGTNAVAVTSGALLAGISAVIIAYRLARFVRTGSPIPQHLGIPAALLLYSGLFAVMVAVGRAPLGLGPAQAPRYIPLMLPAAVGLYLLALQIRHTKWRVAVLAGFVAAGAWAGLHLDGHDASDMMRDSSGKRRWVAAYLQTYDVFAADRISQFAVVPDSKPLPGHLKEVERQHLSLFAPWCQYPPRPNGGDAAGEHRQ